MAQELDVNPDWPDERRIVAHMQRQLTTAGYDTGPADGYYGPQTAFAFESWETYDPEKIVVRPDELPDDDSEAQMIATYGEPGDQTQLLRVELPYPMHLSWDTSTLVTSVTLHKKVANSFVEALADIKNHYGMFNIRTHGMDSYAGGYNLRKKRGGSTWSTHAFGCAVDFDSARNPMKWDHTQAYLAKDACSAFFDIFEHHGWVSLGRELDFDWMHVQKAKA